MSAFDFQPATSALAAIVTGIEQEQLRGPTPCPAYTVGDLVDHVHGLGLAFTFSARKEPVPGGPGGGSGDATRLAPDWREQIPARLEELATAWTEPGAYAGLTMAGPVEVPAEVAALVALNEVIVHGWDLARATGQHFEPPSALVERCIAFVTGFEVPEDAPAEDRPFGRPIPIGAGAPALDRLVAAAGRDPGWRP